MMKPSFEVQKMDLDTAIVEVRPGTGGSEAAIFARDLYRMYLRFAESKKWKVEQISSSEEEYGGLKSAVFQISGAKVYDVLKNESGVHRVQRVPITEVGGRIHTSTATVAVLPATPPVNIEINPEDLKYDFFRSGGKGGQNVNKVSTAVRLTHKPTGVVVECQQERNQAQNREKALLLLKAKLFDMMEKQQVQNISELRLNQIGSGERSEKIRTYNFGQDRITDHRINKSWGKIKEILDGDLDRILR